MAYWTLHERPRRRNSAVKNGIEHGRSARVYNSDGYTVAIVDGPSNADMHQEWLDNTRLLGAAPDLLNALQWIVEFIHEHPEWDDNYFREKGEMKSESLWFNEAQAAIAKATGNNYCPE